MFDINHTPKAKSQQMIFFLIIFEKKVRGTNVS